MSFEDIQDEITGIAAEIAVACLAAVKLKEAEMDMAACERQTHVDGELQIMASYINDLNDIVSELGNRLDRVMRDDEPQKDSSSKEVQSNMVPLASQINGFNNSIRLQIERLESFKRRLEI